MEHQDIEMLKQRANTADYSKAFNSNDCTKVSMIYRCYLPTLFGRPIEVLKLKVISVKVIYKIRS